MTSRAEFKWEGEECTKSVVDSSFRSVVLQVIADTDRLLVKASSSASTAQHVIQQTGAHSTTITASGDVSQDAYLRVVDQLRRLEEEPMRVLLVMAQQELDRQSLLQTIEDLGGKAELDKALSRAAIMVAKAFDKYDGEEQVKKEYQ